ncbi:MAG: hypothetical protein K1X94_36090 [Sandaracinaceae bacterium]|nr:hypothetical protein [Sandaracinaceae bacterium]
MASSPPTPPTERRSPVSDASSAPSQASPARPDDVILPHAVTEDGQGLHVLRKRGESVEAGVVRAVKDGQPLHGDLVRLQHREGTPLFDVEVLHTTRTLGRPPQVATKKFRDGWDRVFGAPAERDEEPS